VRARRAGHLERLARWQAIVARFMGIRPKMTLRSR
jgi:hypothetical protein